MFDYLLTKEQIKLRDEARDFVKWVPARWFWTWMQTKSNFPRNSCGRRAVGISLVAVIPKSGVDGVWTG